MSLQTQEPVLETPEISALSGNTATLTPPYPAVFDHVRGPVPRPELERYFWWHLVKKQQIGEAVVQLGARKASPLWARAQAGFRHFHRARATGYHDITVHVEPGPITRKRGAQVTALAFVPGIRNAFRSVPVFSWRRTSITLQNVPMYYGNLYQIVVAGEVLLPTPQEGDDYGEFIGRFPRIEIEAPYAGLIAEEQEAHARFEQALADHDSLEDLFSTLASDDGVALARVEDVDGTAARGEAGFVTSNKDDANKDDANKDDA